MGINWSKYKTYDPDKEGFGSKQQWRETFHKRMGADEAEKIIKEQPDSPFVILGVERDATDEMIKKAFRKLILFWHPDKNPSPEADLMTKKIIAAYTILTK